MWSYQSRPTDTRRLTLLILPVAAGLVIPPVSEEGLAPGVEAHGQLLHLLAIDLHLQALIFTPNHTYLAKSAIIIHHLSFLMSSWFLGDVIIQEVIVPCIVILEVFNPNVKSKQMSGTTLSCSECYHLTWNGVDLNVPSSCSTMTMSTAPVRVAVLMSLMLLTRPERKFILASDWSRVITRPGYWPLIGCSNFRIPK